MDSMEGDNNTTDQQVPVENSEVKDASQVSNIDQVPPAGTTNEVEMQEASEETFPPLPEEKAEEKKIIKDLENENPMKLGQTWYVVATKWYRDWKNFVGYESYYYDEDHPRPGPIDNSSLIEEGSTPGDEIIKKTLTENFDWVVLHEKVWKTLVHWYQGGPALPRPVVSKWGTSIGVEIRRFALKIIKSSTVTESVIAYFSSMDTIGTLKERMCKQLDLDPQNVRVWDYHNFSKYKLLQDMKNKVSESQLLDGQPILLEEKDENGEFPPIPKSTYSGYSSYSEPSDPGVVGMANLGNTCFMNSSLQCLSNTGPLTDYFLEDKYKEDINEDNPLGMKGELAEEYASLLKDLWSGSRSVITPRDFKYKLERFAPQFAGYQQHDSQELLGFLLDGLHEDLNRVKKKPYRELKDPEGRPEAEVANEMWDYHRSRNDSIIVDWLQGQLKSTLICPDCGKVSVTFDPFMYLSLPLPCKTTRTMIVTFHSHIPEKTPIKYAVEVEKFASIKQLKAAVAAIAEVKNPHTLRVYEVYNYRFFKKYEDADTVDNILDRDYIHVYEVDIPEMSEKETEENGKMEEEDNNEIVYIPLYARRAGQYSPSLFGQPNVLALRDPASLTGRQLYDIVYEKIKHNFTFASDKIVRVLGDIPIKEDEEMEDVDEKDEKESNSYNNNQIPEKKDFERKDEPLFVISVVDSYGTNTLHDFQDDDEPLGNKITGQIHLSTTWSPDVAEHFYDSTEKEEEHSSCQKSSSPEKDSISLQTCIELFNTVEKLGPEDPWYCSQCKEHRQATKKFDLWRLPPVLVIHLKRFSYKNRYHREKLETFVDYPTHDLDFTPWVKGPIGTDKPIYQLYAVSNHYGSLGGGHYTAYGKNKKDQKWYKFDDSSVTKTTENSIKTSNAYVLFYQRKDTIPTQNTTATSPAENATQN